MVSDLVDQREIWLLRAWLHWFAGFSPESDGAGGTEKAVNGKLPVRGGNSSQTMRILFDKSSTWIGLGEDYPAETDCERR